MDLLVTSKYVAHRDTIGYLGSDQQGDTLPEHGKMMCDVHSHYTSSSSTACGSQLL